MPIHSGGARHESASSLQTSAVLCLLKDSATALAGARTLPEMLHACAEAMVRWLGASFARIWVYDEATRELVLEASAGMYTHLDGRHARIPLGALSIGRIASTREPHLTNDLGSDPGVSDPEWVAREQMAAFAGYPLIAGDALIGVVGMFSREEISDEAADALASLADSLALGIRRHRAEEELQREHEVVEALHQIGTMVAQQHHLDSLVQLVTDVTTRLIDAQFGAFFYNVVDENDEHYLLYALSGAPRGAFGEIPVPRKTPIFEPTFRGLGPVRLEDVTKDPRYGRNSPFHGLPHGHPPVRSYLAVPVVARTGEVLGGLFFGHGEPGVFSERDERLVVGTATHAAIAIEGTRFHEQEHRAAVALQRALLPADLPEVEGARVAVRYEAASDLVEIGGDWYDVGLLPDGRLSLTVGDVMGHDVRAAMRMGQVRNALRAYVFAGNEPAEALRKVDDYMEASGLDHMTTVLHAVFEPATGRLCAVRSGHLPPALLLPDGTATWLEHEIPGGPPIGVGLSVSPRAGEVALEAGALLVMMSDGLLERRDEPIDAGMERLSRELAGCSGLPPDAVCDKLVAGVADPRRRDDIALLVLAVDG